MILDQFNLAGKVALVTGAASGLGAAIAISLAEAGADIAAHCRRKGDAHDTCTNVSALGRKAFEVTGDLAVPDSPAEIARRAIYEFGRIDILINNAGTIRRAPADSYSFEDWNLVIDVNLTSVFRLSQEIGSSMIKDGKGGKIVNIASLLSFQGGVTVPAYTASKAAVAGLTKALANEWAKFGININAIAPGYICTKNTEPLQNDETRNRQILERIPAGRWGEPSDVAGAAVFLSSSASAYVQGTVLTVDGGWMAR